MSYSKKDRHQDEDASDGNELRYGDQETVVPASLDEGRKWSDEAITIGVSSAYDLREIHFEADTDIIVLLKPGYGGIRSINSDKARPFRMEQNDLYWLPTRTDFYSLSEHAKELTFINFDKSIRRRLLEALPRGSNLDEAITPISNVLRHAAFSELISDFVASGGLGGRMKAEALVDLILFDVIQQLDQRESIKIAHTFSKPVMRRIIEFIEENIHREIAIETLANLAQASPFHFSRMFKNTTGFPPYQYVIRRRIARAQKLLSTTDLDITQIATATGFSSQSHLTTAFRKLLSVTPRRFRKLR